MASGSKIAVTEPTHSALKSIKKPVIWESYSGLLLKAEIGASTLNGTLGPGSQVPICGDPCTRSQIPGPE